jgi:hypothetical protein
VSRHRCDRVLAEHVQQPHAGLAVKITSSAPALNALPAGLASSPARLP